MSFVATLMRRSYALGFYLALPGVLSRLLWRSRRSVGYRQRWNERFGYVERVHSSSIWVHAVSVGEAIAAIPLINAIKQQYPEQQIVVTSTTPTGMAQVRKILKDSVISVYGPYDVPYAVNRFLHRVNPKFAIIMETELWPNLLHCCAKRKIPVMLANARISPRSARGYQLMSPVTKAMLNSFKIVAAQSLLDAERFLELGLDPTKLTITGNIKFDMQLPEDIKAQGEALRLQWQAQDRPVLIAASTHEGEEKILLKAFKLLRKKWPSLLLVLVPRHPERFDKVAQLCQENNFSFARRSEATQPTQETAIVLGDTMGELRLFYAASDIAFMGGSLVPVGGHNFIEPAILGLPVLSGSQVHNFTEISKLLHKAGALQFANDAKAIMHAVDPLLASEELCKKMGDKAQKVIMENTGAVQKHMNWLEQEI